MKKWIKFVLFTALVVVLAACTANEDAGKKTETDADTNSSDDKKEAAEKVLYLNNGEEPTSFDPSVGFNAVS